MGRPACHLQVMGAPECLWSHGSCYLGRLLLITSGNRQKEAEPVVLGPLRSGQDRPPALSHASRLPNAGDVASGGRASRGLSVRLTPGPHALAGGTNVKGALRECHCWSLVDVIQGWLLNIYVLF